jgi:predicted phage gp36 major capsid-like protein
MAMVPPAAHARILEALRGAQAHVVALRKGTNVKAGYMGFDLVETALASCHAAISGEQDQARVVTMLKTAARATALLGGGDVAPAVKRTHRTLKAILQELEAKDSKNG